MDLMRPVAFEFHHSKMESWGMLLRSIQSYQFGGTNLSATSRGRKGALYCLHASLVLEFYGSDANCRVVH